LAYIYVKLKLWADNGTKILANVIHFAGIILLWGAIFTYARANEAMIFGESFVEATDTSGLLFSLFAVLIGFSMVIHYHLTEEKPAWVIAYKNINMVNLLLSVLLIFYILMRDFFGIQMLLIIAAFAYIFVITKIPAIFDNGLRIVAMILYAAVFVWLWAFNSVQYAQYISNGLLAMNGIAQIAALFALNDGINLLNNSDKSGEKSPLKILILSGHFLLAVTQTMMVQGEVSFNSAVISIMYAVLAFAWIIAGFRLKNKLVRKAGLFLSMASVAKLLVIDTWGLSMEMRVVSYVSLGLILMLISFVYQKLNKETDDK